MAPQRQDTGDHNRIRELLSPFLDGQVTPEERAVVEAHLATCQECARELQSLRWTVGLLHQIPVARVPRSFAIPATRPAPRRSLRDWLTGDLAYGFLRGATALATLLLILVISVDVLGMGLGGQPMLAPAAPMRLVQEAVVEKPAKPGETVVVEKIVEKPVEVVRESRVEPTEAPQLMVPKAMAPAAPRPTQEAEAQRAFGYGTPSGAAAPAAPTAGVEDQGAAAQAPPPAVVATEVGPLTTAVAEAVAPAVETPAGVSVPPPVSGEPKAVPVVAPPARPGFLRQVEIGLLAVIALLIGATLAIRRQRTRL